MIELRNYTHIIWDWNGTLLNDAWLCVDVMNVMLKERGMPLKTVEEYKEIFDFPVKDYYAKLGFDFDREPFADVGTEFILNYNKRHNETVLHGAVQEVLGIMSAKGYSQNILSAREQNELISETKSLGVFGFFDRICGLDDHYAHGKTEAGLMLVRDIGVSTRKILLIGDTRHDAEVAAEVGVDCILVTNGHHSEQRLRPLGVPVISSLSDLIKML